MFYYCCFFSDNGSRCPVYPTDLVIALDMSAGVTPQAFEQMRSAALSLLEDVSIAKTNCPWGARVSVITYSSESRNLLRFTDHLEKKTLLEAVKTFALERTTKTRDIGTSHELRGPEHLQTSPKGQANEESGRVLHKRAFGG